MNNCNGVIKRYYRIPRKQKKAEKSNLILLTKQDLIIYWPEKPQSFFKKIKFNFERWIMAGICYHKYVPKKQFKPRKRK